MVVVNVMGADGMHVVSSIVNIKGGWPGHAVEGIYEQHERSSNGLMTQIAGRPVGRSKASFIRVLVR